MLQNPIQGPGVSDVEPTARPLPFQMSGYGTLVAAYTYQGLAPACLVCGSDSHLYQDCNEYGVSHDNEVAVYCTFQNAAYFMSVDDWRSIKISQVRAFVTTATGVPTRAVMLQHCGGSPVADHQTLCEAGVGVGSVLYAYVSPEFHPHPNTTTCRQCTNNQIDAAASNAQLHREVGALSQTIQRLVELQRLQDAEAAAGSGSSQREGSQSLTASDIPSHTSVNEPPPSTNVSTATSPESDAATPKPGEPSSPPPPPSSLRGAWGDASMDTTLTSTSPNTPALTMAWPTPSFPAAATAQPGKKDTPAGVGTKSRGHDPLRSTVHVKGVPSNLSDAAFRNFADAFGSVRECLLVKPKPNAPYTFAFVEFTKESSASALLLKSGTYPAAFNGVMMHCSLAKSPINGRAPVVEKEPKRRSRRGKRSTAPAPLVVVASTAANKTSKSPDDERSRKGASAKDNGGASAKDNGGASVWLTQGRPKLEEDVPPLMRIVWKEYRRAHDALRALLGGAPSPSALATARLCLLRAAGSLLAVGTKAAANGGASEAQSQALEEAALEAKEVAVLLKEAHPITSCKRAEAVMYLVAICVLSDDLDLAVSCTNRYVASLVAAANKGGWGVMGGDAAASAAHLLHIGLLLEESKAGAAAQSCFMVVSRIVPQRVSDEFNAGVLTSAAITPLVFSAPSSGDSRPVVCQTFLHFSELQQRIVSACLESPTAGGGRTAKGKT